MLPLSDNNPRRTIPIVNTLLIIANVLVFFWELSLGPSLEPVLSAVAFIPARFWNVMLVIPNILTIFISMFLHGGWLHLGGNMLYLWIFGDNIEDSMGHLRFLAFYLITGVAAALTHIFWEPSSTAPIVSSPKSSRRVAMH